MKFGVYCYPQGARDEDPQRVRDGMLSLARTAEAVGFDLVTAGQHYLADFTQLQLMPFLSRLSGEVTMELATGVVLLPFHHPVDLAERIATLDVLNDERTILGVGAGYRALEFENFGIPREERVGRLVENLEIIQRLLTERGVTYDGEYYAVSDATIPVRPAAPLAVWVAANANTAVSRAARIGDAWLVNPHSTISEIAEQKAAHYDPVRRELGRTTAVPIVREAFVAPTHEEAVETARPFLEPKYQRYVEWGQHEAMEDTGELTQAFDALASDRFLLGTPEEVCEELARYEETLDAASVIVRVHWPGSDYETSRSCLELLGDEVIPNV